MNAVPPAFDSAALMAQAAVDERPCVVGALILDELGRVFVHRRSWDRRTFPGCWDIVGGHVEAGEDLLTALNREVEEETGWQLSGSPQLAYVGDWETYAGAERLQRREFDFLVEVTGDLRRLRLERGKHIEFRWIDRGDLALLDENRGVDDGLVRRLVELGLRSASHLQPTHPHATVLLGAGAEAVDALRQKWDPAMAGQIAPHVTVAYPSEADGIDDLLNRASSAAQQVAPFRLRFGRLAHAGSREAWVFFEVEDVDGGWSQLRRLIVRPDRLRADVSPHVTVVHPRTTNRGDAAWQSLQTWTASTEFVVDQVAVTAFDGRLRAPVTAFDLGRQNPRPE
jgi:8-oxo-dGTP diphosphatase